MEIVELSTNDAIFFCVASSLLLLTALISCREAPALCRNLLKVRNLFSWRAFWSRNTDKAREAFIFKQVCERKTIWARRFVLYSLPVASMGTSSVVYNMWVGNARWMSAVATWSLVFFHVVGLAVHLVPSLIRASRLDAVCFLTHVFMAFWISPLGAPNFENVFILQLVGFVVTQVPASAIAAHCPAVLLSHLSVVAVVLGRVSTESDFATDGPTTIANPRTLVFCNIFYTGWVWGYKNYI